jgi:hypothetical protein
LAFALEFVEPLNEQTLDPRPAEADHENEGWDGDGSDDQDGLETDGASLIAMQATEQS